MKHRVLLRHSRRPLAAVLAFLIVIAATLLAGCGGGSSGTGSFAASYAGNWSGMWTDIDGTSGTATMAIVEDSTTKSATVSISLSGGKFGFAGAQTALTGSFDSNAITVSSPSGQPTMATLVIDKSGQFTGTVTGVSTTVSSINYGGPSTSQSVTLNVTVHHTDGTLETGTITLTKQAV